MVLSATRGERVLPDEDGIRLRELVDQIKPSFQLRISSFTKHAKGKWTAKVGWKNGVRFPDRKGVLERERYSIVVIHKYRKRAKPMVLLTTDAVRTAEQARAVVERYFGRWAVEEGHRLIKDRFSLENLRVLTWRGIKRMVFLAHAAFAFMA